MTFVIRCEQAADAPVIHALTQAAFNDAPHTDHTEHLIVDALRAAQHLSISLVAEDDGVIIGHVALSPVTVSDGAHGWFGLGPICVAPFHQRRGVGALLMRSAIDALDARDASGCVLLGDPNYYHRFGFKPEPGLMLPDVPPEYFQVLLLRGSLPGGIVTYSPAFSVTS